jgi:transcriptional regulator with XRE-family HTH domain
MNEKRDKQRLIELGKHLRNVRESAGLSLNDVVARCDIKKSNLSAIENGKKDYTITTLLELARGLGKHPKKLLDGDVEVRT